MAEDKAKSSPDEAEGNDSKVFSLFCMKTILICLCDTIPMPDPVLKIRGARSSRLLNKGVGAVFPPKILASAGLSLGGGGSSPGSATCILTEWVPSLLSLQRLPL